MPYSFVWQHVTVWSWPIYVNSGLYSNSQTEVHQSDSECVWWWIKTLTVLTDRSEETMCVTKRPSPRPTGSCQGNIPFLPALLTNQNRSMVKNHAPHACVCVYERVCVGMSVCLSAGRRWSVTAWSLRPWRLMEREQASCSIWPHGQTEKEKQNTEEKQCQYTMCALCPTQPSISAASAVTSPYFCYHEPHTQKAVLYTACLDTWKRIMRWVLISQVSRTDMNNTSYSTSHLSQRCHCQLFFFFTHCTQSVRHQCHVLTLTLNNLQTRLCKIMESVWISEMSCFWNRGNPLMVWTGSSLFHDSAIISTAFRIFLSNT